MNKQTIYRIWHTIRLYLILDSYSRANYLRKHNVFHSIGNNCTIMDRKVPLYPNLISIGNNVHLASKVLLVPHDAIHLCLAGYLKKMGGGITAREKIGCIQIGDNVFIGSNSIVLCDVKIGSNVIIGAGSVVTRDIPDNSVAGGVPCKVIGNFNSFVQKRINEDIYPDNLRPVENFASKELEEWCWNKFKINHDKRKQSL